MMCSSGGQSLSKMLRRLFVVLTLCGFIATCSCSIVRERIIRESSSINVDCSQNGNSTACANEPATRVNNSRTEESSSTTSRNFEMGFFESGDIGDTKGADEEVTGRKKKGGKGYGKMLLYYVAAMKASLLYFMIHAVAAIAGKAVILAKVALVIAVAAALKKSEHSDKVSYEIIKHPHHSYVQTHSSSVDYDHNSGFGESGFGHRRRRRIDR